MHDFELDRIGLMTTGAVSGVAAIMLYLGIGCVMDAIIGGGCGTHPTPIDTNGLNFRIAGNAIHSNRLSGAST